MWLHQEGSLWDRILLDIQAIGQSASQSVIGFVINAGHIHQCWTHSSGVGKETQKGGTDWTGSLLLTWDDKVIRFVSIVLAALYWRRSLALLLGGSI